MVFANLPHLADQFRFPSPFPEQVLVSLRFIVVVLNRIIETTLLLFVSAIIVDIFYLRQETEHTGQTNAREGQAAQ